LVNYWPFNADYKDYVTGANLSGTGTISFVSDRFNAANKAAYLNPGYFTLPSEVYVNATAFSLMGWIYVYNTNWIEMFMLGNGPTSDNVYYGVQSGYLMGSIFYESNQFSLQTTDGITLNTWIHTAFTFDGSQAKIYINGSLQAVASSSYLPQNILRNLCFIGVDNWTPDHVNGQMKLDDFRIFNLAVNQSTIQTIMNLS
jgi:hypothetical protein